MSYTYDIYLHDLNGGTTPDKPTQPKEKKKETKPKIDESELSVLGKVGVAIGVGVVIAKTLDKAITTIEPFVTSASGDYHFQVNYGNFKQTLTNLANPTGALLNYANTQQQYYLSNQRNEQQRKLFGDNLISYNGGNV